MSTKEERYEKELKDRIELIECEKYVVERMKKKDYIVAGIFTFICFVIVVIGFFL